MAGKHLKNYARNTEWNIYLFNSSGLKQLMSGSQADTSRSWVRGSFKGFRSSADLRLSKVLTDSCFKIQAVWWQTSSACRAATCLWMPVWSLNSCWQHFHLFSLHCKGASVNSLVLTKRAKACSYIADMSLLNKLGLRANEELPFRPISHKRITTFFKNYSAIISNEQKSC